MWPCSKSKICLLPCLLYGTECVPIAPKHAQQLSSAQGGMIKQYLCLGKYSHHSDLLQAMGIDTIDDSVSRRTCNVFVKIFQAESTVRKLCIHLFSKYICSGAVVKDTLLERIVSTAMSPTRLLADGIKSMVTHKYKHGSNVIVDTMQTLLFHDNFVKPWSEELTLLRLLTNSL